ncbi:MAG: hypothetical protein ACO2OT_00110 [Candidatus Caldipriscus sp.]
MRYEDSERFKHILSVLERWKVPMVSVGKENRIKGYLVLKVEDVREFLALMGADLVYDVLISDERMKSLEDGRWEVEELKFSPNLYALWRTGLEVKASSRLTQARERFYSVLKSVKEKVNEEN